MKGFCLRDTLLVMGICLLFAAVGVAACIWLWHAVQAGQHDMATMNNYASRRVSMAAQSTGMLVLFFLLACAATAACVAGAVFTYYLYYKSHR
ncbi:MAG TPA: hypothetical protein VK157_15100 [Phycisphaerales bacterium]|nr:hypothetical protein [Phycisphaerales bacterium]